MKYPLKQKKKVKNYLKRVLQNNERVVEQWLAKCGTCPTIKHFDIEGPVGGGFTISRVSFFPVDLVKLCCRLGVFNLLCSSATFINS